MIIGEKVILREIKKKDVSKILELHNNWEIKKQAMFQPFPVTEDQDVEWIEKIGKDTLNKSVYFAIDDKEKNIFAGYTSLRNINWINRNCYFGISILPELQGLGIGKETTSIMIDFAIKSLNLIKIQLEVVDDNKRAIKLYKQLGFIQEGILKKQFYNSGEYYDVNLMTYLREN